MDSVTGAVIIAAMVCSVIVYAIYRNERRGADERRIQHDEFKARLQPSHEQAMLKILADRDAEIAKATKSAPAPMLEMKRVEG
jgi:hypothetical protein